MGLRTQDQEDDHEHCSEEHGAHIEFVQNRGYRRRIAITEDDCTYPTETHGEEEKEMAPPVRLCA